MGGVHERKAEVDDLLSVVRLQGIDSPSHEALFMQQIVVYSDAIEFLGPLDWFWLPKPVVILLDSGFKVLIFITKRLGVLLEEQLNQLLCLVDVVNDAQDTTLLDKHRSRVARERADLLLHRWAAV